MTHPAVQAVLNMEEELRARLSRMGQTAVQELLQPLFASTTPITGISWKQGLIGGQFTSFHRSPDLLVGSDTPIKVGRPDIFAQKVIGTLGAGWATPKQLSPETRRVYLEKVEDFNETPNEFLKLVFGEEPITVTITASGQITTEPLQ